MTIHYEGFGVTLHHGDCVEVMRELPDSSVDAVVTDPPYGLEFMGSEWDSFRGEAWRAGAGMSKPGIGERKTEWVAFGGGDSANATCSICGGRMRGAKKCPADESADHEPDWRVKGKPLDERNQTMRAFQFWCETWAAECLRVLKPGGHLLSFGGTRTSHRLTCAIEDAGFEIRDSIAWLQGQGFPKSLDVGKAIDKMAGVEREVVSEGAPIRRMIPGADQNRTGSWVKDNGREYVPVVTAAATDDAIRWQGWGTALRPCHEPIIVARKPLVGTVAANVLEYGTGALNIDATRLATTDDLNGGAYAEVGNRSKDGTWNREGDTGMYAAGKTVGREFAQPTGRWPSNVAISHSAECRPVGTTEVPSDGHHPASRGQGGLGTSGHSGQDGLVERAERTEAVTAWACAPGCQVAALDAQSGLTKDGTAVRHNGVTGGPTTPFGAKPFGTPDIGYGGGGGASRFFKTVEQTLDELPIRAFYTAKAASAERPVVGEARHVTVKPLDLMRWLVRLVTPPGGVVLDPFVGSGTTAEACVIEGFKCVAIEKAEPYLPLTVSRVTRRRDPVAHIKLVGTAEPTLFDLL